ncbi:MAG: TIGR03905 family TSCPD domain-containing protein [Clostridia bacterium]|nr:TIGR03905 family TSCPD domain-containing protein [Clostridia bacterium]
MTYKTHGTCSTQINFEVDDNGIITFCQFINGCRGNTQGVSALVKGMHIDEAIRRLKGIQCRGNTSCPDQLATALMQYKAQ